MRKGALLWVVALFVLFALLGALLASSHLILLGTELYDLLFGQQFDPAAQK